MFLNNKNIIFKIRRSKVTDYAALNNCQKQYITTFEQDAIRATMCMEEQGCWSLAISIGQIVIHVDVVVKTHKSLIPH